MIELYYIGLATGILPAITVACLFGLPVGMGIIAKKRGYSILLFSILGAIFGPGLGLALVFVPALSQWAKFAPFLVVACIAVRMAAFFVPTKAKGKTAVVTLPMSLLSESVPTEK